MTAPPIPKETPRDPTLHQVLPATLSDIPTLANIFVHASQMDLWARLTYPNPAAQELRLTRGLTKQYSNPAYSSHIIKAVTSTGEIMGWASFLIIPADYEPSAMWNPIKLTEEENGETVFPVKEGLMEEFGRRTRGFEEGYGGRGRRHMVCAGLCTLPKFQKRGVGTALMRWGLELADKERVPCLLEATPFAHGLYEAVGFKPVDSIDIDLSEWSLGPKNSGWGIYTMYCMVRLPEV